MIRIVEVGPRDGLQNETELVPTEAKISFVNTLSQAGLTEIEVSAFVSPKWVPQLADASDVFDQISRHPDVIYSALVPNVQGFERAIAANVDKIAVFTAASETFTQKNVNTSIDGTFERFKPVVDAAHAAKLPVRGYVSTAFWCPYEGYVEPGQARDVVQRLFDLGCDEVCIGDTIGKATTQDVAALFQALLPQCDGDRLALHVHDTYGRAVSNVIAAYDLGIRTFDSSVAGLGGCPYAPGAAGNVATEAVVEALQGHGAHTSVNLDILAEARAHIAPFIAQTPPQSTPAPGSDLRL